MTYEELASGASLTDSSSNEKIVAAIDDRFVAQRSNHEAHANCTIRLPAVERTSSKAAQDTSRIIVKPPPPCSVTLLFDV